MYCTNCGKENKGEAAFCTDCGKQFDRAAFGGFSEQKTVADIPAPSIPMPPPTSIIPEMPAMPDMPTPQIIAPPPQVGQSHTPAPPASASPGDAQPQPQPYAQDVYNAPPPMYAHGQIPPPPNVKKSNKAIIIAIIIAAVALIGSAIAVSLLVNHLIG